MRNFQLCLSLAGCLCLVGCRARPSGEQFANRLEAAVIRGDLEAADRLLEGAKNPAPLATQVLGVAMVHTPTRAHPAMLQRLVEYGGDLNSPQHKPPVVLQGLLFGRMTPALMAWCIANGYDINSTDENGRTALAVCLDRLPFEPDAQYRMIRLLAEAGADMNVQTGGMPVLHWIAIFHETMPYSGELLELFIEAGVDVDAPDRRGATALLTAVEHGKEAMAVRLLGYGADPDAADAWGTTALFKAAAMRFETCTAKMLERGADVNAVNTGGFTPLRFALSRMDNAAVAERLLAAGADVNHIRDGKTVLDTVEQMNCPPAGEPSPQKTQMILLLKQHGAKHRAELQEVSS